MDFIDCIRIQYDMVKTRTDRALKDLTREEYVWQPAPHGKSIAMNLMSQGRWMDEYLHSRWHKTPDIWETQEWYKKLNQPLGSPRVDSLKTPEELKAFVAPPMADLNAYWEAALKEFLDFLNKSTVNDLDKVIDYQVGDNITQRSIGTLFSTGVVHLDAYVAQMFYLKNLKRQKVTGTG